MADFRNAPIDRHEALAPFSRDHYAGLVQVRHLRAAPGRDAATRRKSVAAFIDAWDHEIARHFADEERLLLDLMSTDDRERLRREHQQLADLARQLRASRREIDPDAALLLETGRTLEQHIRWEERELFQRLQEQLDAETLEQLARKTQAVEASRPRQICRPHRS